MAAELNLFENLKQFDLKHGISTRLGGMSQGPYASLNMSFFGADDKKHVMANIKNVIDTLGMDAKVIIATQQVHSTQLLTVDETMDLSTLRRIDTRGTALEAYELRIADQTDGLITNRADVILMTFYADCVPLMFYDPEKNVVSTVHSGWRGTKDRVGQVAVETMMRKFGTKPSSVFAGIGQSAGQCCYEVDFPVIEAFEMRYPKDWLLNAVIPKDYGKYLLDLKWLNKELMKSLGIPEQQIEVNQDCTICGNERYFSHRISGIQPRGTMAAFVQLKTKI